MLWIEPQKLTTDDDLRAALQNALQLEHATIPPYLIARATLKGNSTSVNIARRTIRKIIIQEMLHMTLVCNILNAIGGHPMIADENFVPKYPSELPMGIAGELVVHLRRFSKHLIENTFMKIEEPELILDIPTIPAPIGALPAPTTIGQFYADIRGRIAAHPDLFNGNNPALQVTGVLGFNGLDIRVTDVRSAVAAITTIIEQGEGTTTSPLNMQQDFAHYYAFQQFSKGMQLVTDPVTLKVSFDANKPITIDDTADVIAMVDDPSTVTYDPADSHAEELAAAADGVYSDMLRTLHSAFNGKPEKVTVAVDLMMDNFRNAVGDLLKEQLTAGPLAGQFAGPRFRYIP
jgi:hypothetical protein